VNASITALAGLRVGHWTDLEAATGCTVILCPPEGAVASGTVRGSAPGSRETALLEPEKSAQRVNAVALAGGSAFGLAAAQGVVEYLAQQGIGLETPFARVPIVPAAVIYDLSRGRADARPTAASGLEAAQSAGGEPVLCGRVGVGAGASCGKYLGFDKAQWGGLGSAAREVGGAMLAALAVANPLGDICAPATGRVVAGARYPGGSRPKQEELLKLLSTSPKGTNTTLVVVATDAPVSKTQAKVLADSAHVGIARAVRPSHTPADGDTTFALSTGRGPEVPLTLLTVAVQEVVAEAIVRGAEAANGED
jgi:L-aminopeptidase/D-esterase-like protein